VKVKFNLFLSKGIGINRQFNDDIYSDTDTITEVSVESDRVKDNVSIKITSTEDEEKQSEWSEVSQSFSRYQISLFVFRMIGIRESFPFSCVQSKLLKGSKWYFPPYIPKFAT
jgi:hypothetical protein